MYVETFSHYLDLERCGVAETLIFVHAVGDVSEAIAVKFALLTYPTFEKKILL